ncbi:fimbrial protein [Dryocola sp. LX212]
MLKMIKIILFVLFASFAQQGFATTYVCYNPSGATYLTVNSGVTQVTTTDNVVGFIKDPAYSWSSLGTYVLHCGCSAGSEHAYFWVFTARMLIPDSGDGWYSVNDYLDIKQRISVSGQLKDVPFTNLNGGVASDDNHVCGYDQTMANTATGNSGNFALRIKKPFIGTVNLGVIPVSELYSCLSNDGLCPTSGVAPVQYKITGTVVVPQNCSINAGTQVVVDMGKFYSGDFSTIGQKPERYTPKTFTIPIKCNDISASANLTLRIQGTASAGVPSALQSDNSDVGVVITDDSGTPLIPNDTGSVIPFTLNDGYESNITLHAYPVGTTGNTPALGQFTTLAYLRVDFS